MEVLTFLLLIVLALLPILGWIYFFNKKQPEKKKYVILTFVAGMTSVLPMKLYEKYWDKAIYTLEHWNIFQALGDLAASPTIPKLLAYFSINILVASFLFIFVALLMFFLDKIITSRIELELMTSNLHLPIQEPIATKPR